MRRRSIRAVAAAFSVLLLVFSAPVSAAADDGVALSDDGTTWSDSLTTPLFDGGIAWVPGDSRAATFFVRNDSGAAAQMHVDLVITGQDGLLRLGDLQVMSSIDGGPEERPAEPGQSAPTTISAGEVSAVDVRVTLPWSAGNDSQLRQLDFDVQVTLSAEGPTTLPTTGGAPDSALLLLGIILVPAGGVLIARAHRRSAHRDEVTPRG